MKNKNGWGILEMIALVGILLFFFLLSIVLIINFYRSVIKKDINVDTKNNYHYSESSIKNYNELEHEIEEAANKYLDSKYSDNSNVGTTVVNIDKLLNAGYYSNRGFEDCDGYVISSINAGIINSKAYIKCDNYITKGYGD